MRIHFLFWLLVVLAGCSDKEKSLYLAAPPPALAFERDTLCIREKDPTNVNATGKGMLNISCSPAGHQFSLSFSDTSSSLHFVYRGTQLQASKPFVVSDDVNTLYCYADRPGIYAVYFTLTDQLGRTVERKLLINCSAGVKPTAALNIEPVGREGSNWLYYINAEKSQQPFGAIMSYHYLIDGDPVVVNRPMLKYFFHQAGKHDVSVYVVDDLGTASDVVNETVLIP